MQWGVQSQIPQRGASVTACCERKNGCQAELPRGQTRLISSESVFKSRFKGVLSLTLEMNVMAVDVQAISKKVDGNNFAGNC